MYKACKAYPTPDGEYRIEGDTYSRRDVLKAHGAWFDGKQRVWSGSKDAARAAGATIYQWVRVAAHCHEPEGGAWATETDVARGYVRLGCGLCDTMAICGDDVKILESAQEATDVP